MLVNTEYKNINLEELRQDSNFQNLSTIDFFQWLQFSAKKIEHSLNNRFFSLKTQQELHLLFDSKLTKEMSYIPVFTDFKKVGSWYQPQYKFICKDETKNYFEKDGMYYTEEALKQSQQIKPRSISSYKEAEELFNFVKSQKFITWEYADDGCFARSDATCQLLINCGVDPNSIFKEFAFGKFSYQAPNGQNLIWEFHTAAGIKLADGSSFIFDLSLEPTRLLFLDEWRDKLPQAPNEKNAATFVETNMNQEASSYLNQITISNEPKRDYSRRVLANFKLHQAVSSTYFLSRFAQKYFPLISSSFTDNRTAERIKFDSANLKLEVFLQEPKTYLLVTADEINDLDIRLIEKNAETIEKLSNQLNQYHGHISKLLIPKKSKEALLEAISKKIAELQSVKLAPVVNRELKSFQDRLKNIEKMLMDEPDNEEYLDMKDYFLRKIKSLSKN